LSDGTEFSATNPTTLPLLSLSVAPGLQYGAGDINNAGDLAVDTGQSVRLFGNTVTHAGSLVAPGGQVEVEGAQVAVTESAQIEVSSPFGDGGQVMLRADEVLRFEGEIEAQGSPQGGDGGAVTISGSSLIFRGAVDATGLNGDPGSLLLAAESITIVPGVGSGDDLSTQTSSIDESALEQLPGDMDLSLQAVDNIWVEASRNNPLSFAAGVGEIALIADADGEGTGELRMERLEAGLNLNANAGLNTAGRDLSLSGASLNLGRIQTNGGDLDLTASRGSISAERLISRNANSGGNVTLLAAGDIEIGRVRTEAAARTGDVGNSGNVFLTAAGQIAIEESIRASSNSEDGGNAGNGGNVMLMAGDQIITSGISASSNSNRGGTVGAGGNIFLAAEGPIRTGNIGATSSGGTSSNGGNVTLRTGATIDTDNINAYSYSTRGRDADAGGNVTLEANSQINTGDIRTYGTSGGAIAIASETAPLELTDRQFDSSTYYDAQGTGGNIDLSAPAVRLVNTNLITTANGVNGLANRRNAGNIRIEASGQVSLTRSRLFTSLEVGESGTGGEIEISAQSLDLRDFSLIDTATFGPGPAGSVAINVDSLSLDSSNIFSITGAEGNAGNITIIANQIGLSSRSSISTSVNQRAEGNGGDVAVQAQRLSLDDGSQLQVLTNGQGEAGNIQLAIGDFIDISGSSDRVSPPETIPFDSAASLAEQEPNNSLALAQALDGFFTLDSPEAINPNVDFSTRVPYVSLTGNPDGDTADYYSFEVTAGTRAAFDIDTGVLEGNNQPIVLFDSQGNRLASNARANIQLGAGGSISARDPYLSYTFSEPGQYFLAVNTISPYELQVSLEAPTVLSRDGRSGLFATSRGTGVGGDINVRAGSIYLREGAAISAETFSSTGGNIGLEIQDVLLLRQGSELSATAGIAQGQGDGGNISIDIEEGFIVAVPDENSDISANAFTGNGGRVNILARGILGIRPRPAPTPQSDITASSAFGLAGEINIETLNLSPNQGLTSLPETPQSTEIQQACQALGSQRASRFAHIGRGGLPLNPTNVLSSQGIWEDIYDLSQPGDLSETEQSVQSTLSQSEQRPTQTSHQILEAQGWTVNSQGKLVLVTEDPFYLTQLACENESS
ncbi:MAG: S-layer family protein, partial [Cyanobacteria bacterium P01_A01_bin.114]